MSLWVQVDEKIVLSCPPVPWTMDFIMVTWKITLRDQTNCLRAYRRDRNETADTNCTDMGVTWATRPDQNPALLIGPVTIMHEGTYNCEMVTTKGSFQHDYHLHVSVPLEVSIFLIDTRTVVCKAVSGKPAAWISWTPEGKCVTEQENQRNGDVIVQSSCYWEEDNVSTVTCSVSHWTGNKSLSLELYSGHRAPGFLESPFLVILFVKLSLLLVLLVIVGILFFQGTSWD
ncbi:PREDICTED: cell surface glycoprotein CD200 receptor 1-like [Chrysochloris asiatica]|uniref:Cell surface glycoprotein CD200 receptor 1-like n=1 Tax=Chrysochloris asiatica TaxID=185453 RepID=A0A9B0WRH0_CHRAS|nr:PREDICTED: cell surface glycoprotein CD200 receptor 1-like [Chrysochloris asiatica]